MEVIVRPTERMHPAIPSIHNVVDRAGYSTLSMRAIIGSVLETNLPVQ